MPDDQPTAPPAPEVQQPPLAGVPPPTEETVPPEGVEQPPPEGEGVSEPPKGEEEAPPEQTILEALDELPDDSPIKQALKEKFGEKVDAAQFAQAWVDWADSQAQAITGQSAQIAMTARQGITDWAKGQAETVNRYLKDVIEARIENPSAQVMDGDKLAQDLSQYVLAAQARFGQSRDAALLAVTDQTIYRHDAARYFSAEDWGMMQQIDRAQGSFEEKLAAKIWLALNAGLRGAPAETERRTKAAEERDAKQKAAAERLVEAVAGARKDGAGKRPVTQPPETRDDRAKLADPRTPIKELEEILARQSG